MRNVIAVFLCVGLASSAFAEVIELKSSGLCSRKQVIVPAGKFVELCTILRRGRVVSWQFKADSITDFNIHYHVDQRVAYPEQLSKVKQAGGRLVVEVDQAYCWMWTNRSAAPIAIEVSLNEASR